MNNWFQRFSAKDPGLLPDAWKHEPNPARLTQHLDRVQMPFELGTVRQQQNQESLQQAYEGVHFTPSKETAALYACGKPPVLLEFEPAYLNQKQDVDAELDNSLLDYLEEKSNDLKSILSKNIPDDDKINEAIESVQDDNDNWDREPNETDSTGDLVFQNQQPLPPTAVLDYLENLYNTRPERNVIEAIQDLSDRLVPEALKIKITNQFRVFALQTIDYLKAIYQIPWYDFTASSHELHETLSDEELQEKGWTKDETNTVFDKQGRIVLDAEDADYGNWLEASKMKPLWTNQQLFFSAMASNDSVWHGTTLARARKAFPSLLG